jgi:cytosine/adenosine deaminase-related metal-dependent hydrolase
VFAEVLGQETATVAARLGAISELLGSPPGPFLSWGLSPHAPYSLSAAAMALTFAYSSDRALQNAIHLAESAEETCFVRKGRGAIADRLFSAAHWDPRVDPAPGCSPVQAMCRDGRLRSGDLVVHGVQVDDADIALIKERDCHVVLCPRSNAALDVGKAPVTAYLRAGVSLAFGTDSLASAPSLSVWEELAFARSWFMGAAPPRTWLEIATLGGARALGLQGRTGELAADRDASFQVVHLPDVPPFAELEEALCAAGSDAAVTHLYLAGRNILPDA